MNFSIRMKATGFSMIEILIAVLVLAIGLLGVAALQMASMSSGQEGYFRTQATAIAEDLASRIKANERISYIISSQVEPVLAADPFTLDAGHPIAPADATAQYASAFVANPYACLNGADVAPPPAYCRPDAASGELGQNCDYETMVQFDQWEVCAAAATLLPQGQVHVWSNGSRLSLAVSWVANATREDTGEQKTVEELRNPICGANPLALAADRDCIVLETIP